MSKIYTLQIMLPTSLTLAPPSIIVGRNNWCSHGHGRKDGVLHHSNGSNGLELHTSLSGNAQAMQASAKVMPCRAVRRSNVVAAIGTKNKACVSTSANARWPEQRTSGGERTGRRT